MTGFVILPDHPTSEPIAVDIDHFKGGLRITVGDTSTTLTAGEARQLVAAIQRVLE